MGGACEAILYGLVKKLADEAMFFPETSRTHRNVHLNLGEQNKPAWCYHFTLIPKTITPFTFLFAFFANKNTPISEKRIEEVKELFIIFYQALLYAERINYRMEEKKKEYVD